MVFYVVCVCGGGGGYSQNGDVLDLSSWVYDFQIWTKNVY